MMSLKKDQNWSGFPKVQSHIYNYNMLFKNENIKSNKTFNLYAYTIAV